MLRMDDGYKTDNASGGNVSRRELIVVLKAGTGIAAVGSSLKALALSQGSSTEEINLKPLFPGKLAGEALKYEGMDFFIGNEGEDEDLSAYYYVEAADELLDELAARLRAMENVEAAYVKPAGESPVAVVKEQPAVEDRYLTPNFTELQDYLNAAPVGIDARYAWRFDGGRGKGVRIIDLEWAWNFTHEDLRKNKYGVIIGNQTGDTNHGTAVLGEIGGDKNHFGVTGICTDAKIAAAAFSMPSAQVIQLAADRLRPGDIMLLEIHRAGPRYNFQPRADQKGYIAIEWWPDDFAAIRYATRRGIIVVEAAGNGSENLDDPIYSVNPGFFPPTWTNPFNRNNRDSRAIVVGAGAPPPGTNGRDHGPDRSRLDFSNYGALIDAQGWGREVVTCGYGDLMGGNVNRWYTDTFSGTSSASPIVVGAIACIQGILKEEDMDLLTPRRTRRALRETGSPQQAAPGRPATQRIGNRPDLRQLIEYLGIEEEWHDDDHDDDHHEGCHEHHESPAAETALMDDEADGSGIESDSEAEEKEE